MQTQEDGDYKTALFIRGQRSMTVNIISVRMEHNTWQWSCGIVTHGRSREFRMHMKNPAQTGNIYHDIHVI